VRRLENQKMGTELLKFTSVKRWISSLEQSSVSRGKELTEETRNNRLWHLLKFIQNTGLNPDELLAESKTDIEKTMSRLTDHFNEQQKAKEGKKGVDWNTACTDISFLRGFFTHNDVIFPKRYKSPQRRISKVSKSDSKTEMYSYNEDNDSIVFENGYLKQFISNLGFRDQTIAVCLLATGADTADLFKLTVGFVRDGKGGISNQKRFFWHENRVKDNIAFKVFFSEEATQYIKRFVEQERADAKSDDLIFVKEDGEALPVHALSMNFRCAAQRMGFAKDGNEKSNPFRPKRFRHIFRTACSNANIDQGFIEAFMGHASTVSAGYLEKSSGLFLNAYVKVEPYITVFGIDKSQIIAVNETVEDLKQRTEELKDQIIAKDAELKDLSARLKMLEATKPALESMLKRVSELEKKLGTIGKH
jgi:integrase